MRAENFCTRFGVCEAFLDHDGLMPLEPFALALNPSDVLAGEHL